MDDPDLWRWVWLTAAAAFAIGEMSTAGSFFLAPFGVGAAVASALAFADVTSGWQWLAFIAISAATFAGMRPLARRLDESIPDLDGVGAEKWKGRVGVVLDAIPEGPGETGRVRVDREEWRAESADGSHVPPGTRVKVTRVEGTRVVVAPDPVPTGDPE